VSSPVCSPTRAHACVHKLDRKTYGFGHLGVCVQCVQNDDGVGSYAIVDEATHAGADARTRTGPGQEKEGL
jgi:hypothetical protein